VASISLAVTGVGTAAAAVTYGFSVANGVIRAFVCAKYASPVLSFGLNSISMGVTIAPTPGASAINVGASAVDLALSLGDIIFMGSGD